MMTLKELAQAMLVKPGSLSVWLRQARMNADKKMIRGGHAVNLYAPGTMDKITLWLATRPDKKLGRHKISR